MTVARLVLFQQPDADQQLDAGLTTYEGRNHNYTPGAALAEASCTDGGCGFMGQITIYYYVIKGDFMAISVGTFLFMGPQAIAARQTFRTIKTNECYKPWGQVNTVP